MENSLGNILKGRLVIVGMGNPLRGDDGLGPKLIEELSGKTGALCIDVGTSPESYGGKVLNAKPETILLVDAVHLGKSPGEYAILKKDEIAESGVTTHNISPKLFIEYLAAQSEAKIYLLGIQPKNTGFGQTLSPEVEKTLKTIKQLIMEVLNA